MSKLMSTVSGSTSAILLTLHVNVAPNSSRVICISSKLLPVPIPVSVTVLEFVAKIEYFLIDIVQREKEILIIHYFNK